jgi:hypothetical protein
MSQRAVERALGRLVTDRAFRTLFFREPVLASLEVGLDLSADELDALRRIPAPALAQLEACIDDRLCRLYVPDER